MSSGSPDTDGGFSCPLVPETGPREAARLDSWTFVDGDSETDVTVPHTWNADQFDRDPADYDRDRKRYRTTIEGPTAEDGRQLLHFEGANQTSEVFVDGRLVGTHRGGYTAFTVDVTDYLTPGERSTLEVAVDNEHDADVPPLDADFTFFGGLYRPVWLVETRPVRVDGSAYGSSGVYVDTPTVDDDAATVRVRADVRNHLSEAVSVDVTHRVLDEGTVLAEFGTTAPLGPSATRQVETVSDPIADPSLWHPSDPHCYRVETTLAVDGRPTDRLESPLGIRSVGLEDGRVTVNGSPVALRGTNRHQDRPGRGNALTDTAHREDVALIAETGANFLRLAHYPQSHAVLAAADRRGLLVWEEIPVVNWVTDSREHRRNCRTRLREMVRQHYNHPSVGIWGFMNEILIGYDMDHYREFSTDEVDAALDQARAFDALLREEDPSRLTAMACHGSWVYEQFDFVDVPDVLGWNLYLGWYGGELAYLPGVLYEKLAARPDQATVVSEYGVGADPRLHTRDPEPWDFTEEFHSRFHRAYIDAFESFPELAGTAQWNAFDFASDGREDTIPGLNQKGLMTHDRTPKDVYHLYRAWRSDAPVVHVATRTWARRTTASGSPDATHPITVYSNRTTVELFHDGASLGAKRPGDGYALTWDVPLTSGSNELRAVAGDGHGETVEDATTVEVVDVDRTDTLPAEGLAINVGSHREIVTDERLWAPDRRYRTDVAWGAVGGERAETLDRIRETALDPLYQHALVGLDTYRLDLRPGTYRVELSVCAVDADDPGHRVVSVAANGDPIVEGLDPVATAGPRTPVTVEERVRVGEDGLSLEFTADRGETLLNALRVVDR
jgi:beta-galactosidase